MASPRLLNALDAYACTVLIGSGAERSEADHMYRLLLQDPDISDIEGPIERLCLRNCPDASCVQLVRDALRPVVQQWSSEQKTELAFSISERGSDFPARFLDIMGETSVNSHVAQACDTNGSTILHKIAFQINWRGNRTPESWQTFVKQLLEHGANIHTTNDFGETPLSDLLRRLLWPYTGISQWVNLLWAVGVDLEEYGRTEMAAWNQKCLHKLDHPNKQVMTWKYGPTPEDWGFHQPDWIRVPLYKVVRRDQVPGGWTSQAPATSSICWHPEDEDALDAPWRWYKYTGVPIASKSHYTGCDEDDPGWSDIYPSGANDDCAHIVLAWQRNRKPSRARCYSLPGGLHTPLKRRITSTWHPDWHRCLYDGKTKLTTAYVSERACVKGFHEPNVQQSCQPRIDHQMRQFRHRFRSKSELFALPYSAYRPSRNL